MISVIIAAYNASKTIALLLNRLKNQTTDFKYEIIIVNDGSTDNTPQIIEEFQYTEDNVNLIQLFSISNSGPAKARNYGFQQSQGEIIVFTDSDCVPRENWLTEMIQPFTNPNIGAVGGTYETLNAEKMPARYIGYDIAYRHSKYETEIDVLGTYSAAFRREIFQKVNGFYEGYNEPTVEDSEISYRVHDLGYKIIHNPEAIVAHPHPDTVQKLFTQQINRAKWRVKLFQRNSKHAHDSYTTVSTAIQPFIWPGWIAGLILLGILHLIPHQLSDTGNILFWLITILFIISPFGLLLMINYQFLHWIKTSNQESWKEMLIFYGLILVRTFAWSIGGCIGFIDFYIRKQ